MATKHKYHLRREQFIESPRNLVVCIDGTWRDPDGPDLIADTPFLADATNVRRFYDSVLRDDVEQRVIYIRDSAYYEGTDLVGQILAGVFGNGARRSLAEAYVSVVLNYRLGDKIFLLGFGRSAAIAVQLAELLGKDGIPEWIHYSKDDKGRIVHYEFACPFKGVGGGDAFPKKYPVDIEMLGLFDTVAAMQLPSSVLGVNFEAVTLLQDHQISPNVRQAYHAVAIDEKRDFFAPYLFQPDQKIEEVWFPGVHNAIGGGYTHHLISDTPLYWMITRAERHGLKFHGDSREEISANVDGLGVLSCEAGSHTKISDRQIVVFGAPQASTTTPKIHISTFSRQRSKTTYRPANVLALGDAYEVVDA